MAGCLTLNGCCPLSMIDIELSGPNHVPSLVSAFTAMFRKHSSYQCEHSKGISMSCEGGIVDLGSDRQATLIASLVSAVHLGC